MICWRSPPRLHRRRLFSPAAALATLSSPWPCEHDRQCALRRRVHTYCAQRPDRPQPRLQHAGTACSRKCHSTLASQCLDQTGGPQMIYHLRISATILQMAARIAAPGEINRPTWTEDHQPFPSFNGAQIRSTRRPVLHPRRSPRRRRLRPTALRRRPGLSAMSWAAAPASEYRLASPTLTTRAPATGTSAPLTRLNSEISGHHDTQGWQRLGHRQQPAQPALLAGDPLSATCAGGVQGPS